MVVVMIMLVMQDINTKKRFLSCNLVLSYGRQTRHFARLTEPSTDDDLGGEHLFWGN